MWAFLVAVQRMAASAAFVEQFFFGGAGLRAASVLQRQAGQK